MSDVVVVGICLGIISFLLCVLLGFFLVQSLGEYVTIRRIENQIKDAQKIKRRTLTRRDLQLVKGGKREIKSHFDM